MDTDECVAPPIPFVYSFCSQNLQCHIFCRSIKKKTYRGRGKRLSVSVQIDECEQIFLQLLKFILRPQISGRTQVSMNCAHQQMPTAFCAKNTFNNLLKRNVSGC